MGSIGAITFVFSDLERSMSRSLRFRRFISHKGAELGHTLLLNINRKACIQSLLVGLHLTLVTLKGECQGHPDFKGLYLIKELTWAIFYYETLLGNYIL